MGQETSDVDLGSIRSAAQVIERLFVWFQNRYLSISPLSEGVERPFAPFFHVEFRELSIDGTSERFWTMFATDKPCYRVLDEEDRYLPVSNHNSVMIMHKFYPTRTTSALSLELAARD